MCVMKCDDFIVLVIKKYGYFYNGKKMVLLELCLLYFLICLNMVKLFIIKY